MAATILQDGEGEEEEEEEEEEEAYIRTFFYVGGGYVRNGKEAHVFREQMYVEKLLPVGGPTQEPPIVLIHGLSQTGTNFLNKPDGGRGWASDFISQGYEVYLVDQTLGGRSGALSAESSMTAEMVEKHFTAPSEYDLWPAAAKHTQWPGTGRMGDAVFDAFYSAFVPFDGDDVRHQTTMQQAGSALLDRIGRPAILVAHSQGGSMPLLMADSRPGLARALVLLEPRGPPFRQSVIYTGPARPWGLTDIPLTFSPPVNDPSDFVLQTLPARGEGFSERVLQADDPPPRQLVNLAPLPILVVTGEASYHADYDYCTVEFLRQAGCHRTEHLELGEVGVHGNGHMFFLEKNSSRIQGVVHDWIRKLPARQ